MPITSFPPIESANEQGIVALGGDLHPDSLLLAYSQGIFPWPISDDYPIAWFSPDPRGIISTDKFHIPRKLKKFLKTCPYKVTFNKCFSQVIKQAALTHQKSEYGTWINEEIINAYTRMHELNFAYSVEVWDSKELIGGLYGIQLGHFFSGESMFHVKDNASKVALLTLLQNLKIINVPLLDTQMVTSVTKLLGAKEIKRNKFVDIVSKSLKKEPVQLSKFSTNFQEILL